MKIFSTKKRSIFLLALYLVLITVSAFHYHFVDFDHQCEHLAETEQNLLGEDISFMSDHFPVCQVQQIIGGNHFVNTNGSLLSSVNFIQFFKEVAKTFYNNSDQNKNANRRGPPSKLLS